MRRSGVRFLFPAPEFKQKAQSSDWAFCFVRPCRHCVGEFLQQWPPSRRPYGINCYRARDSSRAERPLWHLKAAFPLINRPVHAGGGAHKYKTSAFLRPVVHRAIASRGTSARTVQAISARGWQASRPCHRRASSYDRFAPAPTTSPDVPRQTLTVFPMKSGSENVAYRNIAAKRWRVSAASFT